MLSNFLKQDLNKCFPLPNVVAQGVTDTFCAKKMVAKATNESEIVVGVG
jgi:hypothetical protein